MINEQIIEGNHKTAFNLIHYFFSILDILLFFIFICITKCYLKSILKLFFLLFIDILIRFIEIFNYSAEKTFNKLLFISILESCQFILIISYVNKGFINADSYGNRNIIGILEYILFTILFGIFSFPFEILYFKESFILYISKYFLIILCLIFLNKYLMKKYNEYLEGIKYKVERNCCIFSIFFGAPDLAFYLYYFKYIVKVIKLFIINKLYRNYLQMGIICINESAKYSIFLFLGGLLYIYESDPDTNRGSDKYTVTVSQNID